MDGRIAQPQQSPYPRNKSNSETSMSQYQLGWSIGDRSHEDRMILDETHRVAMWEVMFYIVGDVAPIYILKSCPNLLLESFFVARSRMTLSQ
jgi:hypothetical protein